MNEENKSLLKLFWPYLMIFALFCFLVGYIVALNGSGKKCYAVVSMGTDLNGSVLVDQCSGKTWINTTYDVDGKRIAGHVWVPVRYEVPASPVRDSAFLLRIP